MTGFAARFTPETLPGFFFRLIGLRRSGCGNRRNGPGLVVQADVGLRNQGANLVTPK